MAPTATQEDGGEGSRAREWRRSARARGRSQPTAATTSVVGLSEPPASSQRRRARAAKEQPKKTKGSRAAASNSPGQELDAAAPASASAASKRPEEKRSRAGKEQVKKRKTVMAGDEGRVAEENRPRRSKRRCLGDTAAAGVVSASAATEQASSASSAVSSPVRKPYFKRAVIEVDSWGEETLEPLSNIDPAILEVYEEHDAKYCAKQRNQLKLITLEFAPHSCLGNPWFGPTLEAAAETVLKTAKFVLGLSSYIDGKLLKHASGFIIEWDKDNKVATVITSALLICTKSPTFDEWLGKDEFAPHAEVHARLLDKNDTTTTAQLIHYQKHYNFALFKIKMDLIPEIPSFNTDVKNGQECFVLGRDEDQYLRLGHGSVAHMGPTMLERHHYMFACCEPNEGCIGGPLIDLNGQYLGMVSHLGVKFIPSVIILKCLQMLKKFDCVPRLHTGMKFSAIEFLDPVHREKISRKCNVDAGLIVVEVSEGSIAEKVGIRVGDIVECWNGKHVSTTFELEKLLLGMCEVHLDKGNNIGSDVEIPVGIYRVRKDSCCTVILTLKVRDDVEVVAKGEYDVATAISPMVYPDDQDSGHYKPHATDEEEVGGS